MDTASRTDAPPTTGGSDAAGVRSPARPVPAGPGVGIGLPQIPARPTTAPAPVPSLDQAEDPDTSTTDARADETASAGPVGIATAPTPAPAPASFPPGVAAKLGTYVYLLVDARTGRPFFVGRGRGDRCHRHVEAARAEAGHGAPSSKYPLLDRIREAQSGGRPVRIEILRRGLTPAEADLVEATVADALGLGYETRLGSQRSPSHVVGAALAKRAKIRQDHGIVLLRVGPHGSATDYASARHGWRIGKRWMDAASGRSPTWAAVVAGDLVDTVYRIDAWVPSPSAAGAVADRFSFVGTPEPELDARYAGRSVRAYLGTGTPGAITYVWCGPHWVNSAQ
jgi:hypothetical protein